MVDTLWDRDPADLDAYVWSDRDDEDDPAPSGWLEFRSTLELGSSSAWRHIERYREPKRPMEQLNDFGISDFVPEDGD